MAEVFGEDEGVGSGTEDIGIGDRRGGELVKDMGMIRGNGPEKGGVSVG